MSYEKIDYHRQRAEHCRDMAQTAKDPDIRRRHEQLAALHSSKLQSEESGRPTA